MTIASFFAGCGGLDLGFRQAGFNIIWANEIDPVIHATYALNHPEVNLSTTDIRDLHTRDIPECDGFIGGPPCQAWSEGGKQMGLNDPRGQLFLEYIRIIKEKHPKFFLIENVPGIIGAKHINTFLSFITDLENSGYSINYTLLNAADFHVPQDRHRVFVIGFRKELNLIFNFPKPTGDLHISLKEAIGDITEKPRHYLNGIVNQNYGEWLNHDVYDGPWDSKFMARNRVRSWDETSFTIQAQAKNCPLHPQAPKMKFKSHNSRTFVSGAEYLYRRLSVRECARIQTFPDSFRFIYENIKDGYKMVGNAVPPRMAKLLAQSIKQAFLYGSTKVFSNDYVLVGYYKDDTHLQQILRNKIYYVRAGIRRGALQMHVGSGYPNYLLLHNGKHRYLFSLIPELPQFFSSSDLTALGFKPDGKEYLIFRLKDANTTNCLGIDLSKIIIKGKSHNTAIPYILPLQEIIHT